MKIGFIGTGVMGTSIINNLIKAHYAVTVFNRTKEHAKYVLKNGAHWADSPKAVAAQADVVITMVGFPDDVESVYFAPDGILAGIQMGKILIDMTTSTPSLAKKIALAAAQKGVNALDAPVSGGDIGAKKGTLTVMIGGNKAIADSLEPLFKAIGESINFFGPAGMGQHAKLANQIMIAGTMTGLTEMLVYAKAAGLDLETTIQTVSGGSGDNWSMDNYGPRILAGDYSPGFFIKHFVKDLRIALEEADKLGIDLPATKEAKRLYQVLVDAGQGDLGTQGLITSYPSWA